MWIFMNGNCMVMIAGNLKERDSSGDASMVIMIDIEKGMACRLWCWDLVCCGFRSSQALS